MGEVKLVEREPVLGDAAKLRNVATYDTLDKISNSVKDSPRPKWKFQVQPTVMIQM